MAQPYEDLPGSETDYSAASFPSRASTIRSLTSLSSRYLSGSRPEGDSGSGPFVFIGLMLALYLFLLGKAFDFGLVDEALSYQESLRLNEDIFLVGLLLWVLRGMVGCTFQACTASRSRASDPLLEKRVPSPALHQSDSACNYLMYLQACAFLFFTLAVINLVFCSSLATWKSMIDAKFAYSPPDAESRPVWVRVVEMLAWFINGIVALIFVKVIKVNTQDRGKVAPNDRLNRTMWIRELPRRDHQTGTKFVLDNAQVSEVRTALVRSIDDYVAKAADARQVTRLQQAAACFATKHPHTEVAKARIVWTDADIEEAAQHLEHLGYKVTRPKVDKEVPYSVVEECIVIPQTDSWLRQKKRQQRRQDLKSYYAGRMKEIQDSLAELSALQKKTCIQRLKLPYKRLRKKYFSWKHDRHYAAEKKLQNAITEFEQKKQLTGSAFVTFKQEELASYKRMLPDFHRCQLRQYSFFTFGRPPFSSVTLRCYQAPEPSDIEWGNLHTGTLKSETQGALATIIVVVVYILLISPVILVMFSGKFKVVLQHEEKRLRDIVKSGKHFTFIDHLPFIDGLVKFLSIKEITTHAPTIILLFLNTVLLPNLSGWAADMKRCYLKSIAQVKKMNSMVWFLCLSLLLMPFAGIKAIQEVPCTIYGKGPDDEFWMKFCSEAGQLHGMAAEFAMQYMMNATFIISITQVWNVTQRCWKTMFGTSSKPWPYNWGFSYAFTLSIFALAMILGMFAPSLFPMAAVFFWLKFVVDKYCLHNNVFNFTIREEQLIESAIRSMRIMVGVAWLVAGFWTCFNFQAPQRELKKDELLEYLKQTFDLQHIRMEGGIFILLGVMAIVFSFLNTQRDFWWCRCADRKKMEAIFIRITQILGLSLAASPHSQEEVTDRSWDCLRLLDLQDTKEVAWSTAPIPSGIYSASGLRTEPIKGYKKSRSLL